MMKFNTLSLNSYCGALLATLSPLCSSPLHASDDELFFDMPIVLSSNRLEQSVSDAAVSISVIDRETIVASGARNIPEILRLVPGMQVAYSGNEFGSEPKYVVAYHGHSDEYSKQMQVLIDGRSIYEPFFGGINWKSIPVNINDIERIEVSRGPNMATYGSNSFQAAINIITRTAAEDQGSFIQSNLGNNDIADLTYRYGGNSGNLDYRATISTYNDAGLDSANTFDYPDDTHSNNIDYRLDYQVDNKNTLSYQGGYGDNRQHVDQNHEGFLPVARTVENTRFFQFIKWENAINQENTLLLQYYYNLSDKKDRSRSRLIELGFDPFTLDVNFNITSERHNLELTHFIYPNENLKVVWGVSAQTDLVRAPLYLGNDEKLTSKQFRGFANIEWHVNRSNIINLGGLVEKNDFTNTELSPRFSYTLALSDSHKIRFGISQAIRSPFINEAKANLSFSHDLTVNEVDINFKVLDQQILGGMPGNSNLDNERIISREIAYFGTFLDAALLFNARLFHDHITNFIDSEREDVAALNPEDNIPDNLDDLSNGNPAPRNTVLVFQNPIQSTTNGLELELDYHFDTTLRLIASGAIINVSSNSMRITLSAPQYSYSLLAIKQFNEKYNGSIAYYHVDAFKWTDARSVSDDFSTDSYHTLDMRVSRNFKYNRTRGSLSLVLKNLLKEYSDYQENPSNTTAPKVVHGTLAYLDFRLNF